MISSAFWFVAGLFLGWNIKQPEFTKNLQQKIVDFFKKNA